MTAAREVQWTTAVCDVREGQILIRGYDLADIIHRLSFADATYLVLRGELPSPAASRAFDAVLCSILDHAFVSSTIPAARFVASANPDPIAALAAGVLTVGSNTVSPQDSAALAIEVQRRAAEGMSLDAAAEAVVGDLLGAGRRIPGLGHPTHHGEDPRARALREVAEPLGFWGASGAAMVAAQQGLARIKGRLLAINVDGAAGAVLNELKFPPSQIRSVGAMSYLPGIIAHVTEQLDDDRGLKFIRPEDSAYIGVGPRPLERTYGHGSDV
jgi:citrate synthase